MKKTGKSVLIILIIAAFSSAQAQTDSLYYHDMVMESQWGSSTVNDAFGCFVRFTPPSYPATLIGIRGYFRNAGNSSEIKWKVYSDPSALVAGGVNPVFTSSSSILNPAAGGAPNQDYTAYCDLVPNNIVINAGDVYVGAVQSIDFFGIGIDNLPNTSVAIDRQWQWMTVFGNNFWNTLASQASSGQFGITAFFSPFTAVENHDEFIANVFLDHSSNQLHVQLPDNFQKTSLKVYDVNGKLILNKPTLSGENTFDLSFARKGIYFALLNCENKILARKIIVE